MNTFFLRLVLIQYSTYQCLKRSLYTSQVFATNYYFFSDDSKIFCYYHQSGQFNTEMWYSFSVFKNTYNLWLLIWRNFFLLFKWEWWTNLSLLFRCFRRLKLFSGIFLSLATVVFIIFVQCLRYVMYFTKVWKDKGPVQRILQPFMQDLTK